MLLPLKSWCVATIPVPQRDGAHVRINGASDQSEAQPDWMNCERKVVLGGLAALLTGAFTLAIVDA
jgi:hypothetical protein